MGKKATFLFTRILFQAGTILLFIMTVTAWFAGIVSPDASWLIAFLSLGMLPMLVVNLISGVIWACKRSFWAVLPFAAIILNIGFVTAMFQVDFRSESKLPVTDLKIATYNIHGYSHSNFNKTVVNIADYMKNEYVDILCMQEFIDKPDATLDSLLSYFPYRTVVSEYVSMQLAVFSRYPITDSQIISFPSSQNCAMWVDIDVQGKKVRLFNIHFQTTNINQSKDEISKVRSLGIEDPSGKEALYVVMDRLSNNASKRAEQVTMVRSKIEQSKDMLTIVCGDFNDTPASYAYHQIGNGLTDCFKDAGTGYSYTFKPLYKLFRLDYIFHGDGMQGVNYYSPAVSWSDHIPAIAELSFQ